jgi:hypothetical protein
MRYLVPMILALVLADYARADCPCKPVCQCPGCLCDRAGVQIAVPAPLPAPVPAPVPYPYYVYPYPAPVYYPPVGISFDFGFGFSGGRGHGGHRFPGHFRGPRSGRR